MQARELIELAAIVSAHGPALVHSLSQLSATALEQYWTASKCRIDRWHRSIKAFIDRQGSAAPPMRSMPRGNIRGVLEEVLTGEILTRVWTAVLCSFDRLHAADQAEPIARSVLIGHLEARRRVLMLLAGGTVFSAEEALQLDHLRRKSERWIDFLLGALCGICQVSEFAVDPARANDFAATFRQRRSSSSPEMQWAVLLGSLRSAFGQTASVVSPNADLNQQIAASILACFPAELLDSTGLFRYLWLQRLCNVANDTQLLVEQLLALDGVGRSAKDAGAGSGPR